MQAVDNSLLGTMYGWGEAVPAIRSAARIITELGGSRVLVPLGVIAGIWLLARGHGRRAFAFLFVTLFGRLILESMKLVMDRDRPAPSGRIVDVFSQSFPSGHATNSMIVCLALALIVAPLVTSARWPVPLAIGLAILIGLTRPILGVHWPVDVLGGWALGVAWTLTAIWALDRWVGGDPRVAPLPLSR